MNYLQYVYEAVNAAASVPVYSYAAPQGVAEDFIVFTLNGIDVSESKDLEKAERLNVTLFLHFADADDAQTELSTIRDAIKTSNDYTQAYMETAQIFYNEQDESLILSADFTFLINY